MNTESTKKENKALNGLLVVVNVVVLLLVIGLSRTYPLPACIFAAIYFSILLGVSISKYNTAKEKGEDISSHKKSIGGNVAWIGFISIVLIFQIWSVGGFQPNTSTSSFETPAELATRAAEEAKSTTTLPYELDEITRLTDISSSGNNIQYHYIIHDADTSTLTSQDLQNSVQPSICANTSTAALLDRGVGMSYFYTVQENSAEYSFTITSSNC